MELVFWKQHGVNSPLFFSKADVGQTTRLLSLLGPSTDLLLISRLNTLPVCLLGNPRQDVMCLIQLFYSQHKVQDRTQNTAMNIFYVNLDELTISGESDRHVWKLHRGKAGHSQYCDSISQQRKGETIHPDEEWRKNLRGSDIQTWL